MTHKAHVQGCIACLLLVCGFVLAEQPIGPYATAKENLTPLAIDAGIPGFLGPDGRGACLDNGPNNVVNPVFKEWASTYVQYIPAPAALEMYIGNETSEYPYGGVGPEWQTPENILSYVTGDRGDICSLGDLWMHQLWVLDPNHPDYASNKALDFDDPYKIQPGWITVDFNSPIVNGPGPDFAVFENGHISAGGDGVEGELFAELAYVEVSTDGIDFVRFPCVSLTEPNDPRGETDPNYGGTGAYGTINPTNVYNLAGKHANAYGTSWGTPFNLSDLANDPNVINGTVDINNINYIRLVDIPGNGFFKDAASQLIDPNTIDPNTGLGGSYYTQNNKIHDAWLTWGSGGHDPEAIGVIEQIYGDADTDGKVNFIDYAKMAARWQKYGNWPQGDFDEDGFVDFVDLKLLSMKWLYDCIDP